MPHYGSFTTLLCFLTQGVAPALLRFLLTPLDSQILFFDPKSDLTWGFLHGSLYPWVGFRRPNKPPLKHIQNRARVCGWALAAKSFHQILTWDPDLERGVRVQNRRLHFMKRREDL